MPTVPDAGDIIWVDFDPTRRREQRGHRPALVLSPARYNRRAELLLCCPLTTAVKGYPFEVAIAGPRGGVALADQVKSIDWRARRVKVAGRASGDELAEVLAKIKALLQID
ncbi:MAG TPA: endoribonuclease MazF [Burkholderiaceae bacterium]|jgi:mRNA interferase MazF|nr:endoribonuclease MazF [Burkholderiaceae bacterium]